MVARERGFKVIIDNACDDWDYQDAADYLLKRFHELRREFPRLCLLSSGEVTVQAGSQSRLRRTQSAIRAHLRSGSGEV